MATRVLFYCFSLFVAIVAVSVALCSLQDDTYVGGLFCVPAVRAAAMAAFSPLRGAIRATSMSRLMQPGHRSQSSASASTYTYRLAAAAVGKRTPLRPPQRDRDYWMYASTDTSPRLPYLRSSKKDSGEDAFFAATVGTSPHRVAFGLADGVGGWQDQGVDPSEFSHGLCGIMAGSASTGEGLKDGLDNLKAQQLLQIAYDAVMSNPRIVAGGCTASLAVVDGDGNMDAANLGDSGFVIIGPGKVAFRSPVQTHAFNTPYQLSKLPPKLRAQEAIFGGGVKHFSETPKQADVTKHALKNGDIVLFATDGVWDNLSAQDTLQIVTKVMEENEYWYKSHNFPGAETMLNASMVQSIAGEVETMKDETYLPGLLAVAVMRAAKLAGLDRKRDGPFAKEVKQAYPNEGWEGGKPDDIAVVVCVAVEDKNDFVKAKL